MSNTEVITSNIVDLVLDSDWNGDRRAVDSIQFHPGAASDILQVTAGSLSGPVVFEAEAAAATSFLIKYFHKFSEPLYIDFSDCTLSAGHRIIITYKD